MKTLYRNANAILRDDILAHNFHKIELARTRDKLVAQACEHTGAKITVRTILSGYLKGHKGIYIDGRRGHTAEAGDLKKINRHLQNFSLKRMYSLSINRWKRHTSILRNVN